MSKERWQEILRFGVVGGLSFLIDYGLLYVFTEYIGIYYLYSSGLSFVVALIFNYWLCVKFVFKGAGHQTPKQMTMFVVTGFIGLLLNQVCMWFFVDFFTLHYMLAKIIATAIVTVWNYVTKRKAVRG